LKNDHGDLGGKGHKDLEATRLEVHAFVCVGVAPTLEEVRIGDALEDPTIAKALASKATTVTIKFELKKERLCKEAAVATRKTS
jgi:hypothetical protein